MSIFVINEDALRDKMLKEIEDQEEKCRAIDKKIEDCKNSTKDLYAKYGKLQDEFDRLNHNPKTFREEQEYEAKEARVKKAYQDYKKAAEREDDEIDKLRKEKESISNKLNELKAAYRKRKEERANNK